MAPEAWSKFGAPCSNLRSFGSKCTVLKNVLVTLLRLSGAPIVIRRPGMWPLFVASLPPCYAPGLYINCSSLYMSSGWMKQNFTELSPFFSKHLLFTPVFNSDLLPQHMVNRNRSKRLNRLNSSLL